MPDSARELAPSLPVVLGEPVLYTVYRVLVYEVYEEFNLLCGGEARAVALERAVVVNAVAVKFR